MIGAQYCQPIGRGERAIHRHAEAACARKALSRRSRDSEKALVVRQRHVQVAPGMNDLSRAEVGAGGAADGETLRLSARRSTHGLHQSLAEDGRFGAKPWRGGV